MFLETDPPLIFLVLMPVKISFLNDIVETADSLIDVFHGTTFWSQVRSFFHSESQKKVKSQAILRKTALEILLEVEYQEVVRAVSAILSIFFLFFL
jgi:hypothetical protein